MKKLCILLIALSGFSTLAKSQGDQFKPSGKPFMKIFSNYHSTFSGSEVANAFELNRLYLGYEYSFSENFSAKANFDIGDPGNDSKLQMTAYVKNAYVKYKEGGFSINFGLISTTQFKVQEKFWGYRYVEKSFQDKYKFNSSADLGVSAAYDFTDFLSADIILANGEGYKKLESDSALRSGIGLTATPGNFVGRVYYDYSSKGTTQTSLATFVGYADDAFSIGAEYNQMNNVQFKDDHKWNGLSFYGNVKLCDKMKFFARYDNLSSNTPAGDTETWNLSKDGELFIAGIQYAPVKGIKLAPNFSGWRSAEGGDFISTAILNLEIKF